MGVTRVRSKTWKFLRACGVLIVLAVPSPSEAGQDCDASCEPEDSCAGGCEIDSIDCTVGCTNGGCGGQAICAEEPTCPAREVITVNCPEADDGDGGPKPHCPPDQSPCLRSFAAPLEDSMWAVVDLQSGGDAIGPAHVLAESHDYAGEMALEQLISRPDGSWPLNSAYWGRQRLFWVQPGGRCAKVDGAILNRQAPFESPSGRSVVFFDVRIAADGSYVALEPLYSDLPDRTRDAARYLRENLVLSSRSEAPRPLQVFVGLTINEAGQVGYFIAGANELL